MIAAWGMFSVIDTSAKFLVMAAIPAVQVALCAMRCNFCLLLLKDRAMVTVVKSLNRTTLALLTLRKALLVVSTFFNFVAVKYLPNDDCSNHVFVANFRRIVFNSVSWERVGIWRWSAIIIGFIGVLIIVRPFDEDFHWAALLSLHNAVAIALFSMITRRLAGTVNAQVMHFFLVPLEHSRCVHLRFWLGKRQHMSSVGPCFSWLGLVPGWAIICFHVHMCTQTPRPDAIFLFLHHLYGGVILFGFSTRPDIWVYVKGVGYGIGPDHLVARKTK